MAAALIYFFGNLVCSLKFDQTPSVSLRQEGKRCLSQRQRVRGHPHIGTLYVRRHPLKYLVSDWTLGPPPMDQ